MSVAPDSQPDRSLSRAPIGNSAPAPPIASCPATAYRVRRWFAAVTIDRQRKGRGRRSHAEPRALKGCYAYVWILRRRVATCNPFADADPQGGVRVIATDYVRAVLEHFEGVVEKAPGKWRCLCPAHADRNPSLEITLTDDGKLLAKCWTGCSFKAITEAARLPQSAWFPPKDDYHHTNGNGKPKKQKGRTYPTLQAAIGAADWAIKKDNPDAAFVESWEYHDAKGHVAFVVARWNLPKRKEDTKAKKEFRPFHLAAEGWRISDPPGKLPLFGLRELVAADPSIPVYVVEGEGKARLLRSFGFTVTCSAHGADGSEKTDWTPLADRVVIVLPDANQAGEAYAAAVAAFLHGLSKPARVKIAKLPGLEPGSGDDIKEFVELRREDGKDDHAIHAEIEALAHAAPEVESATVAHEISDDIEQIDLPPPAPWPKLRPEACYGLIGEIVETIGPETEADPVGIQVQLLASAGNAIGRTAHARVEGDRHYCNLFVITVGKSGLGRKGTAWGRVRHLMEAADLQWLSSCIASGMSSGEGLIFRVRDPRVTENPEGEPQVIDSGATEKRLMAVETEFGQVLRNLKRESNTLSAVIRNAWDHGNIGTLTKSPLRASNAHISIAAHITEEELHQYVDQVDLFNGFANRFLWACVRRSKRLPEGGRRLDIGPLAQRLQEAIAGARRLGEIERTHETRELWAATYERLTDGRPGVGGIVTGRAEAQVLRLSTLYAALDCSPFVLPVHLQAALAVWDYCEESAAIIFGREERFDKVTQSILNKLREAGDRGLTRTEIRNALNRNVESAKIVGSLAKLKEKGLARVESVKTGGPKPAERWYALTPFTPLRGLPSQ